MKVGRQAVAETEARKAELKFKMRLSGKHMIALISGI